MFFLISFKVSRFTASSVLVKATGEDSQRLLISVFHDVLHFTFLTKKVTLLILLLHNQDIFNDIFAKPEIRQ